MNALNAAEHDERAAARDYEDVDDIEEQVWVPGAGSEKWWAGLIERRRRVSEMLRHPPKSARVEALAWAREHIQPGSLDKEPGLRHACWPEYGYMSPMTRTRVFAQMYSDTLARLISPTAGTPVRGRPIVLEACSDRQANAYWRARQQADLLGLPYDLYLEPILRAALRKAKGKHLPQPNQLYDKLSPARARGQLTARVLAERLYAPDWDARLFAAAYRSDPVQLRARKLLLRAVRQSPDPAAVLREMVHVRKAIPVHIAKAVIDRGLLRAALGPSVDMRQAPHFPDNGDYAPGCTGLVRDPPVGVCIECPYQTRCSRVASGVASELVSRTGSSDPRRARKAVQTRERVRRHRARKAAPDA